ncbi:MAG: ABC transporter ATP-binding protein, partial [bacterium]
EGEVILKGKPFDLLESLKGKIWKKAVARNELESYRNDFKVISTRLFAGKTIIHVYTETQPDASFEPVDVDLEDLYFSHLNGAVDSI